MHPTRIAFRRLQAQFELVDPERFQWAKDFAVGWLAGLIFFGTMLS
jgi:hypothetical protein